jgi:predicted transcriptional regulator
MELQIRPETEAKLNNLAERIHRDRNELLEEAVNNLLAYNEWFERKVNASMVATAHGEVVADGDVLAWVEERTPFRPVTISGEPLSTAIIRERR